MSIAIDDKKCQFAMPSNNGWSMTRWTLRRMADSDHVVTLQTEVTSQFWDRSCEPLDADLVPDFAVQLFQVRYSWRTLVELCEGLRRWLGEQESFSLAIGADAEQSFVVQLAPQDELISSRYKPVFSAKYHAGPALQIGWAYVVDPSCVQLMFDELRAFIQEIGPAGRS